MDDACHSVMCAAVRGGGCDTGLLCGGWLCGGGLFGFGFGLEHLLCFVDPGSRCGEGVGNGWKEMRDLCKCGGGGERGRGWGLL